jgi:DNA helicase II / ATP-dependent DNA helicase PcrA
MNLTDAQRTAINHYGSTLVVACPGSGKTRTLIAKLLHCLDDVRDSPRKIACITYTNAAVYEIEQRLRMYGSTGDDYYCEISTIHAFCLNNILRLFHWRLPEYKNGFIVLPPDSEIYQRIRANVCMKYGLTAKAYDGFELLNREPDGMPIFSYHLTEDVALDFWEQLQSNKFIDFPNIVYYSYRLLAENPGIVNAIASQFAWMLIDEFQDTSALQVEILKLIASRDITKYFLVGDPYQSIYGFAGARPNLMDEFARFVGAKRDFALLTNFRSSPPIIEHAERLLPREPEMTAGGEATVYTDQPEYLNADNAVNAILYNYLPKLNALGIKYGRGCNLSTLVDKTASYRAQIT